MPSRPRRPTAVSALAAGLLLAAGCNRSHTSSPGAVATTTTASTSKVTMPAAPDPSATAGPQLGPPCTIATAALVSGKLGFALTGPNVDRAPTATVCTYDNPSRQAESATVQIRHQVTPESFATARSGFASHGEPVAAVPGLGDEAYSASLSVAKITNSTLVARKGTEEILITTTAPADRLPALMTAILTLL
jgi:hypothetical protein